MASTAAGTTPAESNNNKLTKSLWDEALKELQDDEELDVDYSSRDISAILKDVLKAAEEKKELCLKRRWKFKRSNGDFIILRDIFEKTIRWVKKFQECGDIVVQYDPGHAALPWAAVRFFLQAAVNDVNTFGAMAEAMELFSNLITRYAVLENLYLRVDMSVTKMLYFDAERITSQLELAITKLYAVILRSLSEAKHYYAQSSAKRIARSIIQTTPTLIDSYLAKISTAQADVDACARIADAELQRDLNNKIYNLQITIIQANNEHAQKLRDLLGDMEKPITRLVDHVSDLHEVLEKNDRRDFIRWLSTVPHSTHHKTMISNCLPASGVWLFQKPEFTEWRKSSVSSLLWLHGIPGSGKSKVTSSVIESFKQERATGSQVAPLAFFYCLRNASERQRADPDEIMRSILKQLSYSSPDQPIWQPAIQAHRDRIEEAEEEGNEPTRLTLSECVDLIITFGDKNPITIIIDALDECDPLRRHDLIVAFQKIIKDSASLVKVFFSSRDENDIVAKLSKSPNILIQASDNHADIKRFILTEVAQSIEEGRLLGGSEVPNYAKEKIIAALIEGAQGMFRWVSLQIQNLCDSQRIMLVEDVLAELGRLPKTLSDLYALSYDRISKSGSKGRSVAERALKWLLCAKRPLQIPEFLAAVSVDSDGQCVGLSANSLLNICCNLVVLDDELNVFRFAHLSVREYLETREDYEMANLESLAAERCIDVYLANSRQVPLSSLAVDQNHLLHSYATLYWPFHYQAAGIELVPSLIIKMRQFLIRGSEISVSFGEWAEKLQQLVHTIPWSDPIKNLLYATLSNPHSPLFLICIFGLTNLFGKMNLLKDVDWNQANLSKETGLHLAAEYGYKDVVRYLFQRGADINARGSYGKLPLHKAASHGHVDVGRYMIENGPELTKENANVDATDFDGKTALHMAADNGHSGFVLMLVNHGANVEAKGAYGKTALYRAAENGHSETVHSLLKSGADFSTKSSDGSTALHVAAASGFERVTTLLARYAGLMNIRDGKGKTALDLAAWGEHIAVMRILLDNGADVESIGKYGESALYRAAWEGKETVVRLFLEKRAKIDAKGDNSQTALDCAEEKGHKEIARLLSECGSNDSGDEWLKWIQTRGSEGVEIYNEKTEQAKSASIDKKFYGPNDFEILRLIGRGRYGQVYYVRKRVDHERFYAMKVISKKKLVKQRMVAQVLRDRNVLVRTAMSESPFIVGLKFAFQTPQDLYLVTDYVNGGELFWQLQKEGRFGEERGKFYVAELILVLEHFHDHGIVYQRLKPDKILLDSEGHIAFCDFGLSEVKRDSDSAEWDSTGEMEYLAPEVLLDPESDITLVADFWSLAVILFEMCCGWSPFYAEDTQQMMKNIGFSKVRFPRDALSQEGRQFVKLLLNRNPSQRLGSTSGAEELKAHPFLSSIDWAALAKKQVEPSFKPKLAKTQADLVTSELSLESEEGAIALNARAMALAGSFNPQSTPLSHTMQQNFRGFTFVDETSMDEHLRYFASGGEEEFEGGAGSSSSVHNNDDEGYDWDEDGDGGGGGGVGDTSGKHEGSQLRQSGLLREGQDQGEFSGEAFDM